MGTTISRDAYFETGLEVLSDRGYGGLKLAEVCNRLGVTTGSFYHFFTGWPAYTEELVQHWRDARTVRLVELVQAEPDPRQRVGSLLNFGLSLPHGAECAIRSWSSADAKVRAVQIDVDKQRFDVLYESFFGVLRNEGAAQLFASWTMFLFVGYEQVMLPRDHATLACLANQLLEALDAAASPVAWADRSLTAD